MDGLADIDGIAAHFNGQRQFADQIAGMRPDNAAADNAMSLLVKNQLGETLIAAIGNGASGSGPGKPAHAHLTALLFCLCLG